MCSITSSNTRLLYSFLSVSLSLCFSVSLSLCLFVQQLIDRAADLWPVNYRDTSADGAAEGPRALELAVDLGVGTGLAGDIIRPHIRHGAGGQLVGVDLSPKMVDRARDKGTYDELHVGDIITWLNDLFIPSGRRAQLATAIEVLLYFSDLTVIFRATHASLMPGGLFVATTEALEPVEEEQRQAEAEGKTLNETKIRADQPYIRRYSARHAHRMSYLHATAEAAGFQVLHTVSNATLRIEYGKPALGHFLLLQRPHTSGSEGTKGATEDSAEAKVVAIDRSGTDSGADSETSSGASSGKKMTGSSMAVAHETRRRQARVLSKKAKAIFSSSSGRAEEAVRFLEQALALTPKSTSALNDLGVALLRVGRPKEAAAVFRRCLAQWGASVKDSKPGSERAAQRAARRIQRAEQNLRQAEQQMSMMEDEL